MFLDTSLSLFTSPHLLLLLLLLRYSLSSMITHVYSDSLAPSILSRVVLLPSYIQRCNASLPLIIDPPTNRRGSSLFFSSSFCFFFFFFFFYSLVLRVAALKPIPVPTVISRYHYPINNPRLSTSTDMHIHTPNRRVAFTLPSFLSAKFSLMQHAAFRFVLFCCVFQ